MGLSPVQIEQYLHERIPLTVALGARVLAVSAERVVLGAPIGPNTNNGEMVFGGSAVSLAILAAWVLLVAREQAAGGAATRLLIQRISMSYERPIRGNFQAVCELTDEALYRRFRATLERHGRGRIRIRAVLECDGARMASFEGDFVALAAPAARS